MNRKHWRVPAILASLVLATGLVVQAAPTIAAGQGVMQWVDSNGFQYWKDPVCGTSDQLFQVRMFRDDDYGSTQWRFCSDRADFCTAPYGSDSAAAALCYLGVDGDTANDYPSSWKVTVVNGGANCRVKIFDNAGQTGFAMVYWDPVNVPSLGVLGDEASSIKRVCS